MAQHKKHPSSHQLQKLAAAKYKKDFFHKFKFIINSYCGEDIYSLIPVKLLEKIYLCRSHSFKFVVVNDNKIPAEILNDCKCFLPALIKNDKLNITQQGHEITVTDYYTVGFTIFSLYNYLKNNNFPESEKIKEALHPFFTDELLFKQAHEKFWGNLQIFAFGKSVLNSRLYWFDHKFNVPDQSGLGLQNIIEIYSIVPETISMKIDGSTRPLIRVGWAFSNTGPAWISLQPSLFNNKSLVEENPLKVYIQSHAIERLSERIDCYWIGLVHFNIFDSLQNAKIFYDTNNNILIEYRFFGCKAGYFRADIIDSTIVIRTFLFVTCNGTPEGEQLKKNTGLMKLDIKYLAIDKLSTFMSSDIGTNEEVRQILKDAGCQCLLHLHEHTSEMSLKRPNQSISNLMLNYINRYKAQVQETVPENIIQ